MSDLQQNGTTLIMFRIMRHLHVRVNYIFGTNNSVLSTGVSSIADRKATLILC